MILDHLNKWDKYLGLHPSLDRAFAYLSSQPASALLSLAPGRHEHDGDRIYLLSAAYTTEPADRNRYEAHRRYIDLHYLVKGEEAIAWAPLADLRANGTYAGEQDVIFFHEAPGRLLRLAQGYFAVFYPDDGHKPGCLWKSPSEVRKIVVKVRV